MATLETSPEANSDRRTGRQAGGQKEKTIIGTRATALPKNIEWHCLLSELVGGLVYKPTLLFRFGRKLNNQVYLENISAVCLALILQSVYSLLLV